MQAALVLGLRADVLRRRSAARRRRISHSAQALTFASCTPEACDAPSSSAPRHVQGGPCTRSRAEYSAAGPPLARPQQLSTTSRAPRGQLLLLAVPSSCSSLPSAVLCPPRTVLTTPRPSHPQPSARNRPGEQMSLLDEGTYGRPDAEVLPLITPATTRATDRVRRISHATRGRAPPGGEAVDRAGAGEGSQGEAAARPYDSAHSPSLARPVQAPCPSHPLTHLIPHPLFTSPRRATCSSGIRPFTTPLRTAHRWRWYRRSSRRTRRPPRRRTRYAAPTLPRASEAISGHHR